MGDFPTILVFLWGPDGDKPNFISGQKISLKRLYEVFRGTRARTSVDTISIS